MPIDLKTEAECRPYYLDIIKGCSFSDELGGIYIRHYTEIDNCHTAAIKKRAFDEGKKKRILSVQEKLELLDKAGSWTKEEEQRYKEAIESIEGKKHSLKKLVIPSQIAHLTTLIEEEAKKFRTEFSERATLLGTTLEDYADQIASESHIFRSFYKDESCLIPWFSQEEIDNLDMKETDLFMDIYHKVHDIYTDKNLKRISVCPFFLSPFLVAADDPTTFFGKPLIKFTVYQLALTGRGRYYKQIHEQPEFIPPPEEIYEDLDKITLYYDRQWSLILGKRNNNQLPK